MPTTTDLSHLIAPGLLRDLRGLPFHEDGPLVRWLMAGAELHPDADTHVAVHRVDALPQASRAYCEPHEHVVPEINLILPAPELVYEIVLGDERYDVAGPASVFIPPGVPHSANAKAGTGFFVAILLGINDYADAFAAPAAPAA